MPSASVNVVKPLRSSLIAPCAVPAHKLPFASSLRDQTLTSRKWLLSSRRRNRFSSFKSSYNPQSVATQSLPSESRNRAFTSTHGKPSFIAYRLTSKGFSATSADESCEMLHTPARAPSQSCCSLSFTKLIKLAFGKPVLNLTLSILPS